MAPAVGPALRNGECELEVSRLPPGAVRSSMRGRMLPSHRCRATIDASIILWNIHKYPHDPHDTNSDTDARERLKEVLKWFLAVPVSDTVKKAGASNDESPGFGAQDVKSPETSPRRRTRGRTTRTVRA